MRKEVAKNDPTKYRSKVINDLPDKLTQNGLTKDELDDETKNEIKALEQETDPDKIVEKEVKITQKIGQQGATKKITTFEKRVEAALKSNNKTEIDKLKKELTEYIQSNNVYYQAQKEAAEKLFNQLKQASSTNQQKQSDSPSKIPWGVIIPVSLVGLGAIVAVVVIRNRRKAKLNK